MSASPLSFCRSRRDRYLVSSCHGAGDDPISADCYPSRFFAWWNSIFPHPASELTNGAIRRTNSEYFAFCSAHHLPDYTDLVIIELDTDDKAYVTIAIFTIDHVVHNLFLVTARRSKTLSCSCDPSSCGKIPRPSLSSVTSPPKCTSRTGLLDPTTGTASSPSFTMYPMSGTHYLRNVSPHYMLTHTLSPLALKPRYTRPTSPRPPPLTAIMPIPSWPIPPATVS